MNVSWPHSLAKSRVGGREDGCERRRLSPHPRRHGSYPETPNAERVYLLGAEEEWSERNPL
jgi:hypothetical protein